MHFNIKNLHVASSNSANERAAVAQPDKMSVLPAVPQVLPCKNGERRGRPPLQYRRSSRHAKPRSSRQTPIPARPCGPYVIEVRALRPPPRRRPPRAPQRTYDPASPYVLRCRPRAPRSYVHLPMPYAPAEIIITLLPRPPSHSASLPPVPFEEGPERLRCTPKSPCQEGQLRSDHLPLPVCAQGHEHPRRLFLLKFLKRMAGPIYVRTRVLEIPMCVYFS